MSEITNRIRCWSYHRQRLGKQGTDAVQVLRDNRQFVPFGAVSLELAFYRLDGKQ